MNTALLAAGLRGFDCDEVLRPSDAVALWAAGYRFVLRYVRRSDRRETDLGPTELKMLLTQGFGVMPVQHVESARSWTPSLDKGKLYGANAALAACELGMPKGVTVWCDLEGIDRSDHETIIGYCNTWFDQVAGAGYQPGLYVGWHARLTANELYSRLRFQRYWSAYNLDSDQYPAVRGVCLRQGETLAPVGTKIQMDSDASTVDALGGRATMVIR